MTNKQTNASRNLNDFKWIKGFEVMQLQFFGEVFHKKVCVTPSESDCHQIVRYFNSLLLILILYPSSILLRWLSAHFTEEEKALIRPNSNSKTLVSVSMEVSIPV